MIRSGIFRKDLRPPASLTNLISYRVLPGLGEQGVTGELFQEQLSDPKSYGG